MSVCTDFAKVGSPPAVIGQVAVDNQNTTLQGVLVVLEECWGSTCSVVSVATGEGWAVHAGPVTSVPGATYRTTASWVDNAGRQHHGVSTP